MGHCANNSEVRDILVLGTGGTIAGRATHASDNIGYKAGEVPVSDLLGDIPVPPSVRISARQIAQIDSKDISTDVWRSLLRAVQTALDTPSICGIVITHGTDTLEETAYLLQRVLAPAKPVVIVGAMRPATAVLKDGPLNLKDALQLASMPSARGVLTVSMGRVHSGLYVRKIHTHDMWAFDSGDAGSLGEFREGQWTQWQQWPVTQPASAGLIRRLLNDQPWPRVEWITSYGGQDGLSVKALLDAGAHEQSPLAGLVVAGTGNGTVHKQLEKALRAAESQGVRVVRTTRVARGRVIGNEYPEFEIYTLPPAKARLELMLRLMEI